MRIEKLKTNHITNPLGFALGQPILSFVVTESTGKRLNKARIVVSTDPDFTDTVYDSGIREDIDGLGFELPLELKSAARYYWKAEALAEDGDWGESAAACFETAKDAKDLKGVFIASKQSMDVCEFYKKIQIHQSVKSARAYASALGVYELCINGKKAGEEYLAPGSNDYDSWLQYQTYDATPLLKKGENVITLTVAPGWYSGYFLFEGKNRIYGEKRAAFCDLDLFYEDGTKETIATGSDWTERESMIRYSEIYHGEIQDAAGRYRDGSDTNGAYETEEVWVEKSLLSPRRSLTVVIKERIAPRCILHTPAGETVIDMGQNMAGFLSFTCREPKGTTLHFQYGEVLQNGSFYRENLRTAKAARVIGENEDAAYYETMAEKIKKAVRDEYFTPNGRLAMDTQTGYVLTLAFGICPDQFRGRTASDLNSRLNKDGGYLKTGFAGTPYLCRVLSEYGYHETAVGLLLNEDCPGWLYPVRMGATTIWERWDSILPDGSMNPQGMNSLNHYSYGSIVEWMYRYLAGISPVEEAPGFAKAQICPRPDYRMSRLECVYESMAGTYEVRWEIAGGRLKFHFVIPFGCQAEIVLPDAALETVCISNPSFAETGRQESGTVVLEVNAGIYDISYEPVTPYERSCSVQMKLGALQKLDKVWDKIIAAVPELKQIPLAVSANKSLESLGQDPMVPLSEEDVDKLEHLLRSEPLEPDRVPDMIMDL